jgi:hypothetical protein
VHWVRYSLHSAWTRPSVHTVVRIMSKNVNKKEVTRKGIGRKKREHEEQIDKTKNMEQKGGGGRGRGICRRRKRRQNFFFLHIWIMYTYFRMHSLLCCSVFFYCCRAYHILIRFTTSKCVSIRSYRLYIIYTTPTSSVGIALGSGLDDRSSRVRFPAGDVNFSLHHRVQNGSGAHPASYPMGTRGSFTAGKEAGA